MYHNKYDWSICLLHIYYTILQLLRVSTRSKWRGRPRKLWRMGICPTLPINHCGPWKLWNANKGLKLLPTGLKRRPVGKLCTHWWRCRQQNRQQKNASPHPCLSVDGEAWQIDPSDHRNVFWLWNLKNQVLHIIALTLYWGLPFKFSNSVSSSPNKLMKSWVVLPWRQKALVDFLRMLKVMSWHQRTSPLNCLPPSYTSTAHHSGHWWVRDLIFLLLLTQW